MISATFRIVRAGTQFRGRIVGKNGKTVWWTERYPTKALVGRAVRVAREAAADFALIDETKKQR